jgi:heptosyltransferase II
VTPASAPLLARHPAVRSVIVYDKRGDDRGLVGLWRAARVLRTRYHSSDASSSSAAAAGGAGRRSGDRRPIAYLAQGSIRSGLLAWLAGFEERVGFDSAVARSLYTRLVPYREDRHHAERLWSLGAPAAAPEPTPAAVRPRLYPGESDGLAVDALLRRGGHAGEPLIALAPGSAWATKRWPYYPALAAAIAPRVRVVVIGGPDDRALAAEIVAAVGETPRPAIDATGTLSLLATAELIGRCAAVVTNDSAPQHLASAMGTPTVTVYGPTVAAFGFGPLAPRHAIAGVEDLSCRPCDRHGPARCPLGHWRCMRDLPVAQIEALLHQVSASPPS